MTVHTTIEAIIALRERLRDLLDRRKSLRTSNLRLDVYHNDIRGVISAIRELRSTL